MRYSKVNPIARTLLQDRRRSNVVPNKKNVYNKSKERQDAKKIKGNSYVSKNSGEETTGE